MDRETGPEAAAAGSAAPADQRDVQVPPRAIMAGLAADPRVPIWARRAVLAAVAMLGITFWIGWRAGLTVAVIVTVIDTVYHTKTMSLIPAAARVSSAQRRTRHRLATSRMSGYQALH